MTLSTRDVGSSILRSLPVEASEMLALIGQKERAIKTMLSIPS
jgi:hypothetical protein